MALDWDDVSESDRLVINLGPYCNDVQQDDYHTTEQTQHPTQLGDEPTQTSDEEDEGILSTFIRHDGSLKTSIGEGQVRSSPDEIQSSDKEDTPTSVLGLNHQANSSEAALSDHQTKSTPSFTVESLIHPSSDHNSTQNTNIIPSISTWFGNSSNIDQQSDRPEISTYQTSTFPWASPEYNYILGASSEQQPSTVHQTQPDQILRRDIYPERWSMYDWLLASTGMGGDSNYMPVLETPLQETLSKDPSDKTPIVVEKSETSHTETGKLAHDNETVNANTESVNVAAKVKPVNLAIQKRSYKRYPKPPYTYAAMSIMAIENSPRRALQYREIADALREMFPTFFKGEYQGWQRSVRHMLSRLSCFEKEKIYAGKRQTFQWRVDLNQVEAATFMRQDTSEDLRTTDHTYKMYLHEELGCPPVILPKKTCKNDGDKTAANVSRAIRSVLTQHQLVKPLDLAETSTELPLRIPNLDIDDSASESNAELLSNEQNWSTLPTDSDDFLGARPNGGNDSMGHQRLSADDDMTSSCLPKYLIDSPVQSPIPLDNFRETEGLDRYCPSAESSLSIRSSVATPTSTPSLTSNAANIKKRKRESTDTNPNKRARTTKSSNHQKQATSTSERIPSLSGLSSSTAHPPGAAARSYRPVDFLHQYLAANSAILPDTGSLPSCWPPLVDASYGYRSPDMFPFFPFGCPPERVPWQHFGYQLQLPVSYGYQNYMQQYGVETGLGYQQIPNEVSGYYRHPHDAALNLSTK